MVLYNYRKGDKQKKEVLKMNIGRIISTITTILIVILFFWIMMSFIEVWCKNLTELPQYSEVNIFKILSNFK
jgi:hypothetical protein